MTDKIRVYISGAITGTDDYIERFKKIEEYLKFMRSYEIVNPAEILGHLPDSTTHGEYMHVSYSLLDICDGIYMIDGWKISNGAIMEYDYALEKGLMVLHE